jgi:hypothetical protein
MRLPSHRERVSGKERYFDSLWCKEATVADGRLKKTGQNFFRKRFDEVKEPDEKLLVNLWGWSSRGWMFVPPIIHSFVGCDRYVFLSDQNIYLCRPRTMGKLEVITKQPLGSVRVTYSGHRFKIGSDHAMSHPIGPNSPKVAASIVEIVNKRFDEQNQ